MRCAFRSPSVSLTGHKANPKRVPRRVRGPQIPLSGPSTWRAVVRVLRSTAAGAAHSLTSVVFPADCRACGLPLSGFSLLPICKSCWNDLPAQTGALCSRCGEALPGDPAQGPAECRLCRASTPAFEKAVAHGVYSGRLRILVHLLKYDGMEPLARHLGQLLAERVLAIPDLPEELTVVPVPLWSAKHRQRGFNQAEHIARGAMEAMLRQRPDLRLKLVAGALARQRATESQAGLSPRERRLNVRGAFFVAKPAAIDRRNVILIDDIYTTGATARACAQALRSAGATRVWVGTVARAQREDGFIRVDPEAAIESKIQEAPEIPMEEDAVLWDRPPH